MPTYTRVRTASDLFPVHVVDQDGLPHIELTAYACRSPRYHSPRTAYAYLGEVVAFASRAESDPVVLRQGWRLLGPPDEVRRVASHVLASSMRCVLVVGRDRLGFETCAVKPTWQIGHGLERLLAALRSFYAVLRHHGFYPHANPMEADGARAAFAAEARAEAEAFRRAHGRNRMPHESGVDAPPSFPVIQRHGAAAYFRLRGERWLPAVLDDPALMGDVLEAGERWGWSLRETALARVLFDAGPRIGEVCALTLADWRPSGFLREMSARNKGSLGRRTKRLILTDRTVKLLRRYVDLERSRLDPQGRRLADFLRADAAELAEAPLFLTSVGGALDPDHYRRNLWTPALQAAGIKLRPHQVRHWHVTQALNTFAATAKSEAELAQLRQGFREGMGWRSDMLPVYDQARRRHDLPRIMARVHARIEQQSRRQRAARKEGGPGRRQAEPVGPPPSEASAILDNMLGGGRGTP